MAAAAILLYHRVAEPATDPWWLSVSTRRFAAQLDVLRRSCDVVPLGTLLDRSSGPRPRVAITFDDGYVDNLVEAAPALVARLLPASVFVVTSSLAGGSEPWWDCLDRVILRAPALPDELRLESEADVSCWPVSDLDAAERDGSSVRSTWRAWEPPEHGRQQLYLELYDLLFAATPSGRDDLIGQLVAWAGCSTNGAATSPRGMTTAELLDLAAIPGIEIGAHTMSHPRLAALSVAEQEQEIVGSRRTLEQSLGRPVPSFSYPFGRRSDYSEKTVGVVRRAAFDVACSTQRGLVEGDADPLQLPRLQVHDWDTAEFERWLADAFADGS